MNWDQFAVEHLAVMAQVFNELRPRVEEVADELVRCLKGGGKVLVCGNGGSAADAQHIAGEFLNRFLMERKPYACIALTTDTSTLTAIGNDYSFDQIFEKQVQALGRHGDLLIAISTSGKAANVIRAAKAAKELGVRVVVMTGGAGGDLAPLADICLSVTCTKHTPRIQEGHLMMFHAFCELLEEKMESR
ncbi:MAG: D-sedoheptulose 7-phosphate isomerase [Kiritimatiellae bacterium]|nr:D-sedoheptulose 7-phosphate isomerase [Kiritimatiellia bacterium]